MSKHLLRLLAIVLAFGLVAAACGDDDDDDATSDTTTTAAADDTDTTTTAAADDMDDDMAVPDDWPESIVFGFVPSQEQGELQDDIAPFIDVLEEGLGIEVVGQVTTDYTGLVTAMGTGTADFGAFGPFAYTLGTDQFPGEMEALIQSIRFGSATYHGQWFTNDPSICDEGTLQPATALENVDGEIVQVGAVDAVALQVGVSFGDDGPELGDTTDGGAEISPGSSCTADLSVVEGETVAFVGESSTSGYIFPALELTNLGIDPTSDITPVFAGGHDSTVITVFNGDAKFGLSYDDARREIRDENPDVGENVIVFSITREIPNDVVAARTALPDSLKEAVFTTIEDYLATDEGAEVFDEIYSWTDIQRADESDFDIVREAATALGITEPPG